MLKETFPSVFLLHNNESYSLVNGSNTSPVPLKHMHFIVITSLLIVSRFQFAALRSDNHPEYRPLAIPPLI